MNPSDMTSIECRNHIHKMMRDSSVIYPHMPWGNRIYKREFKKFVAFSILEHRMIPQYMYDSYRIKCHDWVKLFYDEWRKSKNMNTYTNQWVSGVCKRDSRPVVGILKSHNTIQGPSGTRYVVDPESVCQAKVEKKWKQDAIRMGVVVCS